MPSGIVLSSGSIGATPEAIEKVLADNGYESEKPDPTPAEVVEPKREDFKTDEEFEAAQEEFDAKQEEAEAAEEAKREAEDEKKAAADKKPSRRQRAIEKATKDLRAENKKLEERIKALESKSPAAQKKLEDLIAEAVAKVPKPKRTDFADDEKYGDAMADYGRKVSEAERQARAAGERQVQQASQIEKSFTAYQTAVAAFKEEHDDWDEVIADNKTPISEGVYLAVIRAKSPAVTYYLSQNPEVLAQLNEMDAIGAAMEIGQLARQLAKGDPASGAPKPKTKPRVLPTPVRPLSTAPASSTLTSAEAAKARDFKAFKAAQRAGR